MNKITLSLLAVAFAVNARAAEIAPEHAALIQAVRLVGPQAIVLQGVPSLIQLASLDLTLPESASSFKFMAQELGPFMVRVVTTELAKPNPDVAVLTAELRRGAKNADVFAEAKAKMVAGLYKGGSLSGPTLTAADGLADEYLATPHVRDSIKETLKLARAADHARRLAGALKPEDEAAEYSMPYPEKEALNASERLAEASPERPARHEDLAAVARYYRGALKNDEREKTLKRLDGKDAPWPSLDAVAKYWNDEFFAHYGFAKAWTNAALLAFWSGVAGFILAGALGVTHVSGAGLTAFFSTVSVLAGFGAMGLAGTKANEMKETRFQVEKLQEEAKR